MIPRVPFSTIWTSRHNGKLLLSGQPTITCLSSSSASISATVPLQRMSSCLSCKSQFAKRKYTRHKHAHVIQKLGFLGNTSWSQEQVSVQRRHYIIANREQILPTSKGRNLNFKSYESTNCVRCLNTSNHGNVRLSQQQGSYVKKLSKVLRDRLIEREKIADLKRAAPVVEDQSTASAKSDWVKRDGYDTGIMVQNSLTKQQYKKEPLVLCNKSVATWYSCGPTVYDSAHIGHASCFVRFDILRRIMTEFYDIDVVQVQGITDIDTKIIRRAEDEGIDFYKLTKKYENEFLRDLEKLQVLPATVVSRVTDHMPQIIKFIQRIIGNGYAYSTDSGDVYFDLEAFGLKRYKKLATHYMEPGKRNTDKRNQEDFSLWKAALPGEPWWHSPWGSGKGRPGWHIECSVMANEVFGENLDIHTGGRDLAFPHHNNEIAQCEGCFNSDGWARYFLHSGHLFLKSDPNKMSKSLKNVVSIQDFLQSYTTNHFRVLCLMSKYNNDIEYSEETVRHAVKICKQLASFLNDADSYVKGHVSAREISEAALMQKLAETQTQFMRAIADDFDTKRGLDAIMELVRAANMAIGSRQHQQHLSVPRYPGALAAVASYISRTVDALGIKFQSRKDVAASRSSKTLASTMDTLINLRSEVRQWALDTPLQDDLKGSGVTQEGQVEKPTRKLMYKALHRRAELLQKCDNVRQDLLHCGIQIKDRQTTATWEYVEKKGTNKP
ncbi:probable cysteine--tRNA ligase, mitochondrial [Asterias rubens]|uniref:probable cysteine--tRNA ligase, mitochondrial n=1 Tax=Asterias rubens TaxID=7604 RepID=UPI00145571FD|nr:probable cysteine--tRNA ligase, mitochondrial [Asterias rubens]